MDSFKRAQNIHIGPGGIHCPCCNIFSSKTKNNKSARSILKRLTTKEIDEAILEMEVE